MKNVTMVTSLLFVYLTMALSKKQWNIKFVLISNPNKSQYSCQVVTQQHLFLSDFKLEKSASYIRVSDIWSTESVKTNHW